MSDKTTVHFRFDVQVSVDVGEGIELNQLQKRMEQHLRTPSFEEAMLGFTRSEDVTNKQVVTEYRGMSLGRHVLPDVDPRSAPEEMPAPVPEPSHLPHHDDDQGCPSWSAGYGKTR